MTIYNNQSSHIVLLCVDRFYIYYILEKPFSVPVIIYLTVLVAKLQSFRACEHTGYWFRSGLH